MSNNSHTVLGEKNDFPRATYEEAQGKDVVVSGSNVIEVHDNFHESTLIEVPTVLVKMMQNLSSD